MKVDLSKVKVGDKIWTIEEGWTKVVGIDLDLYNKYPIETRDNTYTIDGKIDSSDKFPSAFIEYPFKEQPIEKDTLVWFRDTEDAYWKVGYYSHCTNGYHCVFEASKKSTETDSVSHWNIVTTENPFL
jgi:hypothetical protein